MRKTEFSLLSNSSQIWTRKIRW